MRFFLLLVLSSGHQEVLAASSLEETTSSGQSQCPYIKAAACLEEPSATLLRTWDQKTKCWLCDNGDFVGASKTMMTMLLHPDVQPLPLPTAIEDPVWANYCVPAFTLALFATTRSQVIQTWQFYQTGVLMLVGPDYDASVYFDCFGVTPTQLIYTFYVIGLAFSLPKEMTYMQEAEYYQALHREGDTSDQDLPLVIDIGMGLGGDSRWYLSQGFRVVGVEANRRASQVAASVEWVQSFLLSGQFSVLHAAVAPPGEGGKTTTIYTLGHRPEQSNAQEWVTDHGGMPEKVRTVECADLLRVYGRAVYMKIDVESSTVHCLESLHSASKKGDLPGVPLFLSLELEAPGLVGLFHDRLTSLGYTHYKVCRQYLYSPAPCEQGAYDGKVPGCGSGPFGESAVDYLRGPRWAPLETFLNDTDWIREFESGLDWFDLHVKLGE